MATGAKLTLSSQDVARLETALATALAPLEHDRVDDWLVEITRTFRPLVGGHKAILAHTLDRADVVAGGEGPRTEEAVREYQEYFGSVDPGVTERRKRLGLEVFHRDQIYDPDTFFHTEIGDWCARHRLFDAFAVDI